MNRVVLDTNVFISAYGFGVKPADVLRAAILGRFTLVTSAAILAETADKLHSVLDFDDEHVRGVLLQVARIAEIASPDERLTVIADEPDNRVLECAIAANADVIVSGDSHLLDLGTFRAVEIVRVADFLTRLDS